MGFSFFNALLVVASLNGLGQAYRLEGDLELTRDPGLELFRYLNKWIDYEDDIHSFGDFQPGVAYTFYTPEEEILDETYFEEEEVPLQDDLYDLGYLSFSDKEHLKSVGSIWEIARITGLPLLSEGEEEEEVESDAITIDVPNERLASNSMLRRLPTRGRNQHDKGMAKRAICEPEKVSVSLRAEEGFRVVPSCVRIKKCGGCCNPGLVCVPTKTKKLKLKVMEIALNNSFMQWKVLDHVSEDEECGCQCGVKEEHCLPTQDYNKEACSCFCKPELETVRRDCEANGRLWDTYRCSCQCPLQRPHSDDDCGSGQIFNPSKCNCENA